MESLDEREQITLCEALDRILNKGVVISGEVTISVADVDLIYLGLRLILTSAETARELAGFFPTFGTVEEPGIDGADRVG